MHFGITERGDAGLDQSWRTYIGPKIAITKNPELIKDIDSLTIVHCTITGFGGKVIEPNVPRPQDALREYHRLVDQYGPERIVLRVDPIVYKREIFAENVLKEAMGRVRISFLDAYPHVRARLAAVFLNNFIQQTQFHAPIEWRQEFASRYPEAEICGEPDMKCTGCISERDYKALGLTVPENVTTGRQRKECLCLSTKKELLTKRGQCKHGCLYCYWK